MSGTNGNKCEKCEEHLGVEIQIKQLQKSDDDQWSHITRVELAMQKFVPVWVAVALTTMGTVTGVALGIAGMVVKFAGG